MNNKRERLDIVVRVMNLTHLVNENGESFPTMLLTVDTHIIIWNPSLYLPPTQAMHLKTTDCI